MVTKWRNERTGGRGIMAKERDPQRDAAKNEYIKTGGKATASELGKKFGKNPSLIRRWKKIDNWDEALTLALKKKKGGQPGNSNAKGHGGQIGNKNAEKHGIYGQVKLSDLTAAQAQAIKDLSYNTKANMLDTYKTLKARETKLLNMIKELDQLQPETLLTDSVSIFEVPKTPEDFMDDLAKEAAERRGEIYLPEPGVYVRMAEGERSQEKLKMRITNKSSPFQRKMKVEAELTRVGRSILKVLDSMKNHEVDMQRLMLENKKYELSYMRATGQIDFEPDVEEEPAKS